MDGRKYQRKSGIKRTLVMLLALVMLASVCFPAMRVNAEGTPDVTVEQGKSTTYAVENCGAATITVDPSDGKPEIKPSEDGQTLTIDAAAASAGTYTVNLTWPSVEEGGEAITSSFVVKVTEPVPVIPEDDEVVRSEKAKEFDDQIAGIQNSVSGFDGKQGTKDALVAQVDALKSSVETNTEVTDPEKTELLVAVGTLTETVNGLTVATASEPVISDAEAYLQRIEDLKGQIENLDPDTPDYEDQLEETVAALGSVVEEAAQALEDGTITEAEYAEIEQAANEALDVPKEDGTDPSGDPGQPFASQSGPRIVHNDKYLKIQFKDVEGNDLRYTSDTTIPVGSDGVTLESIAKNFSVKGYTYDHAYYENWRGNAEVLTQIQYNKNDYTGGYFPWKVSKWVSLPNGSTIYLVYSKQGESGDGKFVNKGDATHLEVQVDAVATLKIEGETDVTTSIELSTDDVFTIAAEWNGKTFTDFRSSGDLVTSSDQFEHATLRQNGRFPVGTKEKPVNYTISITKDVTFTLSDGSTHTVPVTFSVTGNFWDKFNLCPATYEEGTQRKSWWENGEIRADNAGMDFPISGEAVGTAITRGKLAIKKTVTGTTDTETFQFTIKNAKGEYLTFNGTACTATSATLTDACNVSVKAGERVFLTDVPVGVYTITELQKDGYIVTDADGNSTGNYTLDYTVENKEDDSIPVASFTNKKLINEAGVSIQKTASGLPDGSTYPNPTVTIYKYNGGAKGEQVWSGTLTANWDRLYLTTTLDPGTYLIEETGYDAAGYNCTASLSGNATISGMTFTVEGGKRYDLTVNNQYSAIPPESEDMVYIQVQKTFEGLTTEQINALKDSFTITVTDSDGKQHTLRLTDTGVVQDGFTFTWTLAGLNGGTYTVSESGKAMDGYDVTTTGTGTITTAASTIKFYERGREQSCASKTINVGDVDYIIVKLTDGYFVWTRNTLSANKRSECIKFISTNKNAGGLGLSPDATEQNCHFFSGDKLTDADGLYFREGNVRYDKQSGTLHFDSSSQWTMCVWGTYIVTGNDAEVSIKNTYTPSTTSVTVTKTVSGNMGDTSKEFSFTASLTDASMIGITYELYQKDASGNYAAVSGGAGTIETNTYEFTLKHDQKIVFTGVKIGAQMTVTETTDYTVTYKIDSGSVTSGSAAQFTVGNSGNTVEFNNTKNATIDTGIVTDSIPYILLMTMAVIGAGVLLLNKRRVF